MHEWLPLRFFGQNDPPRIEWFDVQGISLRAPFLSWVSDAYATEPERITIRTWNDPPFEQAIGNTLRSAPILIFHTSRCGSSAVVRALQSFDGIEIFSQPNIVTDILRWSWSGPGRDAVPMLRTVATALALIASGRQRAVGVKFTSYALLEYALLQEAFEPRQVLFIVRDPLEIIVSALANPPEYLRSREQILRQPVLASRSTASMHDVTYIATLIGSLMSIAANNLRTASDDAARALDHRQIGPSLIPRLVSFLGIEASASELAQARASFLLQAKARSARAYVDDRGVKQSLAGEEIRSVSKKLADSEYQTVLASALTAWRTT